MICVCLVNSFSFSFCLNVFPILLYQFIENSPFSFRFQIFASHQWLICLMFIVLSTMSIRVRTDLFIDSGGTTGGIEIPENTISDKDVPLRELIFPVNIPWLNENLVMKDMSRRKSPKRDIKSLARELEALMALIANYPD